MSHGATFGASVQFHTNPRLHLHSYPCTLHVLCAVHTAMVADSADQILSHSDLYELAIAGIAYENSVLCPENLYRDLGKLKN